MGSRGISLLSGSLAVVILALFALPAAARDKRKPIAYDYGGKNWELRGQATDEWTDSLTVCDPVRMELWKIGYQKQEPAAVLTKVEDHWKNAYAALERMKGSSCTAEVKTRAGEAMAKVHRMEDDVMPGIRAEACSGVTVTSQQRVTQIRESIDKIPNWEQPLMAYFDHTDAALDAEFKNFMKRIDAILASKEELKFDSECWFEIYEARVAVNSVSCEMFFAKERLKALLERNTRGIASVAACESDKPKVDEKKAAFKRRFDEALYEGGSNESGRSDVTGTEGD